MSDQEKAAEDLRLWPFAKQYKQVLSEGHQKQAPAIGSPTLIWHFALWPHEPFGDRRGANRPQAPTKEETTRGKAERLFREYDRDNDAFFQELNAFAIALQKKGRVGGAVPLQWSPVYLPDVSDYLPDVSDGPGAHAAHRFLVCNPQALAFTLWWQDETKGENKRQSQPAPSDMRVRVMIQNTSRPRHGVLLYRCRKDP